MSVFGFDIDASLVTIIKGGTSKHDALDQLIDVMAKHPSITDAEAFRKAVHEREHVMSTGIGGGVGIPHVRLKQVSSLIVGVGVAPKGLDYDTLDNEPVYVMVLFATPEGADREYLRLLAQVMGALRKDSTLFEKLMDCRTPKAVADLLNG